MRAVVVTALIVLLSGCGASTDGSPSEPAAALLEQLRAEPHRAPARIDPHGKAVTLVLGLDDRGRALLDGAPIPVTAADLRLSRAMTRRRTTPPRFWAMVREERAEVIRYWVPLDASSMIRANVPSTESDWHEPELREVPTSFTAVRLPFFPRAEVEFVRAKGTEAGAYRFGEQPSDPMVRLR